MAESTGKDLVSKCTAIQYGLLVAGVVLLVVAVITWHKKSYQSAPVASAEPRYSSMGTRAPTKSNFAGKAVHRPGRITEGQLSEGFIDYRADQNWSEQTYPAAPAEEDADAPAAYDAAKESLEQSVFDSHKEFVEESYTSTQGASSANVERDDDVSVVPWVGLRRPDYSGIVVGDDARTVPSEFPDQVGHQDGRQHTNADASGLF